MRRVRRQCELVFQRAVGHTRASRRHSRPQDDLQRRSGGQRHRSAGHRQLQRDHARLRPGPPVPRRDSRPADLRQPCERAGSPESR